ncbi:MAG: SpoIIE family protein phosphatase [Planctomycetes bacterium]|nr:SpoIIE family protein phosphatase [Planctomycetota bacterium]
MTDPIRPSESPAPADGAAPPAAHAAAPRPKLLDLIDRETLQAIQDGFSRLAGMATSIRDEQGRLVTTPSCSQRFCELIGGPLHDNEACRISNYAAAAAAQGGAAPVKYVCHAGLVQFAAAIQLEDRILGTIVLGDLPDRRLRPGEVADLAREHGVDPAELAAAAAELEPVAEDRMRSATSFLQLLANTLTRLCYQQAVLRERVDELTLLSETSRLLSSTLDPDAVLDNIVRTLAEVMRVKACSLRLLNPPGDELVIAAAFGLSPSYLRKGPVLVAENPNDQAALRGESVIVPDMRSDPHVRYGDAARREGLVSSLSVGLIAKGKPLGTLHIYTAGPHEFTPEDVRLFRSVADQAAITVQNTQLVEEVVTARQQQHELTLAAKVQKRLLPARAPAIPGYDCYGITVPSLAVGGDFHDWIELPGGNWGIAVGDVAGKGVPGAILMASVRAALRAHAEHVYALDHIMRRINKGLVAETEVSEFVTLFYGVLDSQARRLTYASAGHEPAVLIRGGEMRQLRTGGPLLGVAADAKYEYEAVDLGPGDTLVVFSDGACDAANYQGQRFGRDRLMDSIRRHAQYGAERAVDEIHWDIRRFTGLAPRADDLTLLVMKVL